MKLKTFLFNVAKTCRGVRFKYVLNKLFELPDNTSKLWVTFYDTSSPLCFPVQVVEIQLRGKVFYFAGSVEGVIFDNYEFDNFFKQNQDKKLYVGVEYETLP